MTSRIWVAATLTLAIVAGGWMAARATSEPVRLRSPHGEPARSAPAQVAVTSDGKLFHRPDCPLIHGPAHLESGPDAIALGLTPCTRCLPAE